MKIKIFQPWAYTPKPLDFDKLQKFSGRKLQYASQGRAAIYHLMKALGVSGQLLVPVYICESALAPLKRLGVKPVFYDIDAGDLNGSLESIKKMHDKTGARAVLVASLYGNPANLLEIEKYCAENKMIMIDDGAQSFGATLDGRAVLAFGDGGFFSFSPGKSTAGHMGSFFWSKVPYSFQKKRRPFFHWVKFVNFYFNRLYIYDFKFLAPVKFFFKKLDRLFDKLAEKSKVSSCTFDRYYDDISEFEKPILGGISSDALEKFQNERQTIIRQANKIIDDHPSVRAVKCLRGSPHNHKIVWVFNKASAAQLFIENLGQAGIYASNGFPPLMQDLQEFPNMASLSGRIVEVPIEKEPQKMSYLISQLKEALSKIG